MYQRMMVPLDGSELAQVALPHALDMCRAFGATLVLLHVRDRGSSAEASQRYLDYTSRQLANSGVPVELSLHEGSVAETIVRAAESERIDVIVMATHGRSGLKRVVYGSVAEEVLHSAGVPVLLVRAGTPAEQPAERPAAHSPA